MVLVRYIMGVQGKLTTKSFSLVDGGRPLLKSLYPIKLDNNLDVIDRVSLRFPYLNRAHIMVIIQTIFTTLRELVLQGNIVNLYPLAPNFRLYVFKHSKKHKDYPAVKVKVGEPLWKEQK